MVFDFTVPHRRHILTMLLLSKMQHQGNLLGDIGEAEPCLVTCNQYPHALVELTREPWWRVLDQYGPLVGEAQEDAQDGLWQ